MNGVVDYQVVVQVGAWSGAVMAVLSLVCHLRGWASAALYAQGQSAKMYLTSE